MIKRSSPEDIESIYKIINDGATAYQGIVPAECLHSPYMGISELESEINSGVTFFVWE